MLSETTRWAPLSPSHSHLHLHLTLIDTHHTESRLEWNRRWRSQSTGWCFPRQQGEHLFLLLIRISIFTFLSQTLTTMNLERNEIGNDGAKALGDAFRDNKVTFSFSFPFSSTSSLSLVDTHHTESSGEGNRRGRCRSTVWWVRKKQREHIFLLRFLINIFTFLS